MVQDWDCWLSKRPGGRWIRIGILCAGMSIAVVDSASASDHAIVVRPTSEAGPASSAPAAPARSDQRDWNFISSQWASSVLHVMPVRMQSAAGNTGASRSLLFWQFRSALDLVEPSGSVQVRADPATRLGFDSTWLEVSLQLRVGF